MKLIQLSNLSTFAQEIKAKYAELSALQELQEKVTALEVTGGQANVLEGVKVNGTALAIAEKMVNILIATGTENGTISVNNANVAVAGLQALAYKAKVSETDLDTALAAVLAAKASNADLTALSGKVTTLIGDDANKSVRAISAEEVAKIVADAPEAYNTLKELSDWLAEHETDASAMNSSIQKNKTDIANLTALVGNLPDGVTSTTVVDYIAEAIGALGISDYAKTTEVTAAINTALASYYTKTEIDTKLGDYAKTADVNNTLGNYYKKTEVYAKGEVYAKSETYTKTEVDTAIDACVQSADIETVTEAEIKALLA